MENGRRGLLPRGTPQRRPTSVAKLKTINKGTTTFTDAQGINEGPAAIAYG